jgi:hypothetical protein
MNLKDLLEMHNVQLDDDVVAALEPLVKVKAKAAKANVKFVGTGKDLEGKIPLQMKQAISVLSEEPVDVKDWAAKLTDVEGFRTQQAPEKIVAFYKKRIVDEGYAELAA